MKDLTRQLVVLIFIMLSFIVGGFRTDSYYEKRIDFLYEECKFWQGMNSFEDRLAVCSNKGLFLGDKCNLLESELVEINRRADMIGTICKHIYSLHRGGDLYE